MSVEITVLTGLRRGETVESLIALTGLPRMKILELGWNIAHLRFDERTDTMFARHLQTAPRQRLTPAQIAQQSIDAGLQASNRRVRQLAARALRLSRRAARMQNDANQAAAAAKEELERLRRAQAGEAQLTLVRSNCGTNAGYQAHRQRGETACERCLEAKRSYITSRRHGSVDPVRAWAREHNYPVGDRGRIPAWIADEYAKHHPIEGDSA